MPRPRRPEIDAEIVDRAAALFARQGFAHTSLQQIADAVEYSKAGLLHHYPSKEAIYQAAITACREYAQKILAQVEFLPVGPDRDRAVIEAALNFTFTSPGVSTFADSLTSEEKMPDLVDIGTISLAAFGIDPMTADEDRMIRVASATAGLKAVALMSLKVDMTREWRQHIIEAAIGALGHSGSSTQ